MITTVLVFLIFICCMGALLAIAFDMWLENDIARTVGFPLLITAMILAIILILIHFYFALFYRY